jgi:hypothetical protein
MPDYKAMYYHLAGQMSIAIEALEGLVAITEKLKTVQQTAEEMFINGENAEVIDIKDLAEAGKK